MTKQKMTKEQEQLSWRMFDDFTGHKRMNEFRRCPTAQEEQEASQKEERKEDE